ncbi:MAG: 30S ribosomal protein S12 methylthiotransferase RimO [Sphaerochaetaceae bacterium]|nr:30S ribosomal protein S12 methylthiotransferase RimO [Sphaerochaetaceae bacterium]
MKKIYIESLGCAKNQVDSEILLSYADDEGYERTQVPSEADVIVVNTCGFIESAKTESIDTFFSFRNAFPDKKIVLAGCLAQRYATELELNEADAIFGNHDLGAFPKVLEGLEKSKKQIIAAPEYPDPDSERDERKYNLSMPRSAFLKISEGCNHRCNYCAIPLIRGGLRSRPFDAVMTEARRLVDSGIYEINIIAQDLGAYGTDWGNGERFCELIKALSEIEGNFVLRMLYIHPDTFPEKLIDIVKNSNGKILPYFDIPFQHADHKVLVGMKRTGSREIYVDLIKRIRKALPDAVIRSTLMLGFPGEGREEFEELLRFVEEAQLDWMGSFLYSREEDTPAYSMRNQREHNKAHKEAAKWQVELEELQSEITAKRLESFVGKKYLALVEENIKGEDLSIARIYSQAPEVDGATVIMGSDMKPGDVVEVGIRSVRGVDLEAIKIRNIQ